MDGPLLFIGGGGGGGEGWMLPFLDFHTIFFLKNNAFQTIFAIFCDHFRKRYRLFL